MAEAKTNKQSESAKVDEYMSAFKHPLSDVLQALRNVILSANPEIGEEIKWNAPTFFYTGEMAPSDPKEYRRYLVVSNVFKKGCIRLVFWQAGHVTDENGFLQGDYADGRRLALFHNMEEVESSARKLQDIINQQLELIKQHRSG